MLAIKRKSTIFAPETTKKGGNMQTATAMPRYDFYSVVVPHVEAKKFRTIIKALGFDFVQRKKNGLDEAIEDIHAGRVKTMSSIDEFIDSL